MEMYLKTSPNVLMWVLSHSSMCTHVAQVFSGFLSEELPHMGFLSLVCPLRDSSGASSVISLELNKIDSQLFKCVCI